MKQSTHILSLTLILAFSAACRSTSDTPDWVWFAGDLHVHSSGASNDTDGLSWPEDIAATARERGLDWLVLTDHSNSTGSMHCEDVEDCPNLGPEFPWQDEVTRLSDATFVMVDGNELSPVARSPGMGEARGHVGCLPPRDGFTFDGAFIDRPDGDVTGASAVEQCVAVGGWAIVNHPFPGVPWITYDWSTTTGFQGLEVWNGGLRWDQGDERALAAWECLVASGASVVPVAGSDNHKISIAIPGTELDPPLGQPRTSVALEPGTPLTWPAIRNALAAGRVLLHEENTEIVASRDPESATWMLRGHSPLPSRLELRRIPLGTNCDPSDPDGTLHEVVFDASVEGAFEQLTPIATALEANEQGPLYAAITRDAMAPSMEGDVAMTGLIATLLPQSTGGL
ncbi:MAG TPA: hypothetical protein DIU15_16840 [Deltaproteobacteria bacterium]|nr:hypothetical protein [Deltaproteobacteria bacterium]HCP47711.1 hypothetical protein [Deltaproteobacteria bacterium]